MRIDTAFSFLRPGAGLVLLLALAPLPTAGQEPAVPPSPAEVLGWELGERFTETAAVERYFRALAEASPLVYVEEYGRTWEGRPLHQIVIAGPEHRRDLSRILDRNRELTEPATPPERAREIARRNPAIVYFSYGVHGNESSSSEAAMWTAWDLVRGAPDAAGVLDSVVVVLDPVVNPDGRERYVGFYRGARGMKPNPDPRAREHHEPWPGGRTNHYLFDLNRDWTWMSQVETRARLATWPVWNPQVHVDFHEMSWRSSYFFFPPAAPVNPIYPAHTHDWAQRIGEGNAVVFDRQGWLYFTEESYDLFYPGYGDTWPALLGAVGMTYEQAGGGFAGLVVERPDGTLLTLEERATHHRAAGLATLRTVAEGKTDLLEGFASFHRTVDEGLPDILLVPGEEGEAPGRFRALFAHLQEQGIRMEVAMEPFQGSGTTPHPGWDRRGTFPTGTVRVRARQPRGRLALTLLQPETVLDATFSYDISAWSLPYAFGVEAHAVDGEAGGAWQEVDDYTLLAMPGGLGRVGAILRPGFESMPALADFLEAGGRAVVLRDTFRIAGVPRPRGTILLPRALNDDLERRMEEAGLTLLAEPVETALTSGGPDLGTGRSRVVTLPRIALLAGEGTSSNSFGAHWFFLEHRLGVPFEAVNVTDVSSMDLADYDVIVVPDAPGLGRTLGDGGTERLTDWVRGGGTLVAVAGGARELAGSLDVELRQDPEPGEDEEERLVRALRTREERELDRWESRTPGAILQVRLDPGHPLSAGAAADGMPGRAFVLSTGNAFEPAEDMEAAVWFPAGVERISGVISADTLERLSRSAWLVEKGLGRGRAILFADDPVFRIMWYGAFPFYANAVLLSAGG